MPADWERYTEAVTGGGSLPPLVVRTFFLSVLEGSSVPRQWQSQGELCSIGSHETNDLIIEDPTVSRFHCEISVGEQGALVRDLGSLNRTLVDGVAVKEAFLKRGSLLRLGKTTLRFDYGDQTNRLPIADETAFGALIGRSASMRYCFALLGRAARTETTVLLDGETGTGKELAASAIHQASPRRDGPFVVVDCGAMPGELIESELFGHERGAFTGAVSTRVGAFEEASGGTIFLDEIGELPLELQPKLLRVLERRHIRRVGADRYLPVDVRVIAATHCDLRAMVNQGRFRSDLYYRLAVMRVSLPPLRKRPEDVPLLVGSILNSLGADPAALAWAVEPGFLQRLQQSAWPGNVRELRNYLERCLVFQQPAPMTGGSVEMELNAAQAPQTYSEARRRVLAEFERTYVQTLLGRCEGNVSQAAREAGVDRAYFYRILKRSGVAT